MNSILVLGGGASGYAAAISAARLGAKVTILERGQKTCRKVSASGNGRCNLTARKVSVSDYRTHSPKLLQSYLGQSDRVYTFLQSIGIAYDFDAEGRGYPLSRRASSVVDALHLYAQHYGVEMVYDFAVQNIQRHQNGFDVVAQNGTTLYADRVIVAMGSSASPQLGGTPDGYQLAGQLGLRVHPVQPALVPLTTHKPNPLLKGCRVECSVRLGPVQIGRGEVLFTEYGLSGIAVMELSTWLDKGDTLSLDLFPDLDVKQLFATLFARCNSGIYPTVSQLLVGLLDKPIAYAVTKTAGLSPLDLPLSKVSGRQIADLAAVLKDWHFALNGPLGDQYAQVCLGGVDLAQLDGLQSTGLPGTYWCGEVLDVTGRCGGYNLHWAWLSGILAGEAAAKD